MTVTATALTSEIIERKDLKISPSLIPRKQALADHGLEVCVLGRTLGITFGLMAGIGTAHLVYSLLQAGKASRKLQHRCAVIAAVPVTIMTYQRGSWLTTVLINDREVRKERAYNHLYQIQATFDTDYQNICESKAQVTQNKFAVIKELPPFAADLPRLCNSARQMGQQLALLRNSAVENQQKSRAVRMTLWRTSHHAECFLKGADQLAQFALLASRATDDAQRERYGVHAMEVRHNMAEHKAKFCALTHLLQGDSSCLTPTSHWNVETILAKPIEDRSIALWPK